MLGDKIKSCFCLHLHQSPSGSHSLAFGKIIQKCHPTLIHHCSRLAQTLDIFRVPVPSPHVDMFLTAIMDIPTSQSIILIYRNQSSSASTLSICSLYCFEALLVKNIAPSHKSKLERKQVMKGFDFLSAWETTQQRKTFKCCSGGFENFPNLETKNVSNLCMN